MYDDDMIMYLSDIKDLKGISFACWFPKFEEVVQLVILSDIEFLLIVESWLNDNIPDDFIKLDGYNYFRLDRNPEFGRTRGGGILAYCKTRFNWVFYEYLNIQDYHIEMLVFRLKLNHVRDTS